MDHSAHMDHFAHMNHSAHMNMTNLHEQQNHTAHQNHVDMQDKHAYHVPNVQSHGQHSAHDHHASHDHQAFFNTGLTPTVLFENWVLDTKGSLFLACLFTFILAIGYQGTKWFRHYLHVHYKEKIHSIKSKEHAVQTVLYVTEFIVSYLLMLIVMTYNLWVFLVTILGIALGYFFLAWHKELKQPCPAAGDCQIGINPKPRNYDQNTSSQELMPLGKPAAACNGCHFDGIDEVHDENN